MIKLKKSQIVALIALALMLLALIVIVIIKKQHPAQPEEPDTPIIEDQILPAAEDLDTAILGKWYANDENETMVEFSAAHTYTSTYRFGTGTWHTEGLDIYLEDIFGTKATLRYSSADETLVGPAGFMRRDNAMQELKEQEKAEAIEQLKTLCKVLTAADWIYDEDNVVKKDFIALRFKEGTFETLDADGKTLDTYVYAIESSEPALSSQVIHITAAKEGTDVLEPYSIVLSRDMDNTYLLRWLADGVEEPMEVCHGKYHMTADIALN